jgi:predicted RNase H-like HicB family nuclease
VPLRPEDNMDGQTTKRVAYYSRLHYPIRVTAATHGFRGCYPDLPGCSCIGVDLPTLYATLEQRRRQWITARIRSGEAIPLPNSHLTLLAGAPVSSPAEATRATKLARPASP